MLTRRISIRDRVGNRLNSEPHKVKQWFLLKDHVIINEIR